MLPWPETVERVVICIGTTKAATTLLYRLLEADERVHVSHTKEVHYWDLVRGSGVRSIWVGRARKTAMKQVAALLLRPVRRTSVTAFDLRQSLRLWNLRQRDENSVDIYAAYLSAGHAGQAVIFESTPDYEACTPDLLARMAAVHSDTRLVLMMRDPVDRLWSDVRHRFRKELKEGTVTRNQVLEAFRNSFIDTSSNGYRKSNYAAILGRCDAAGVTDQLTCIFYETLTTDTELAQLEHAFGFPLEINLSKRVNVGVDVAATDALVAEATKALSPVYEAVRKRFGDRVPASWRVP
ncbi:sulfotransferase [Ruegeria arenilitoris]|uniref:sulfotransferase n=1 Tax=Ruegeria arenilitoris TaxID=1173585 RepID=UPI0020C25646|nr:sulfotransferase [Ruegeria arenilitoris]